MKKLIINDFYNGIYYDTETDKVGRRRIKNSNDVSIINIDEDMDIILNDEVYHVEKGNYVLLIRHDYDTYKIVIIDSNKEVYDINEAIKYFKLKDEEAKQKDKMCCKDVCEACSCDTAAA